MNKPSLLWSNLLTNPLQTRQKTACGYVLIIIGLFLCAAGIRLWIQPEMYQAAVRVKVKIDPSMVHAWSFFDHEQEVIRSQAVLANVTPPKALPLLVPQIRVRLVPNTTLIEICIVRDNPDEAARIANATADNYIKHRLETVRELLQASLKSLSNRATEQEDKITAAIENLEKMRTEVGLSEAQLLEVETQYPEYAKARRRLDDMNDFLLLLKRKIKLDTDELLLVPKSPPVEIIERAVPPTRPMTPNGPIQATLVMFSFLTGVVAFSSGMWLILFHHPQAALGDSA